MSPSTRRAWIEMLLKGIWDGVYQIVALHPEGVDRNAFVADLPRRKVGSPSIRRAWIEIWETYWQTEQGWVTLHPEGVDRNMKQILWLRPSGVSPST